MGYIAEGFFHWGLWASKRPLISILIGLCLVIIGFCGFINSQTTADPQELWVPPASRANVEQEYFNEEFGAFYRIDTAWIVPNYPADANNDLFQKEYLNLVYYLQTAITYGEAQLNGMNFTLDDFCYKPISGEGCIVESPMQYFKSDPEILNNPDTNVKVTAQCIPPPDQTERTCFDSIGTPTLTYAVFGGIECQEGSGGECQACLINASGLQLTYLLNKNAFSLASAEEWERQVFIRNIKSFNYALGNDYHTDMDGPMDGLSYNATLVKQIQDYLAGLKAAEIEITLVKADYLAERSIEDNIVLETQQNSAIVVVSYIMMFFYVSMAIGFFPDPVHTKFGLGTAGILVVLGALVSSIGLTFYFNQKLTMIGAEVVPFLILAIGVDNIFLISRAERTVPKEVKNIDLRIAYALKDIGPSIFAAATCEALAFFVGLLTDVPALQNFCLVAGLGVVTDFFLQMTIYIGALSLDNRRIAANRSDVVCCLKKREEVREVREEIIRTKFQDYFVPILFQFPMKIAVFAITGLLIVLGIMAQYKLVLGLNQNVSLVKGSDTYDYFESLYTYGDAGPPCYLVFKDVNYTYPGNLDQMNLIAAQLSTLNSTVLPPVYSWTTSYTNFINSAATWSETCGSKQASLLPFEDQMKAFVNIKILSPCCQTYGICGEQYSGDIIFDDFGSVTATRFRYQNQPLKYQSDYIDGLVSTRRIMDIYGAELVPVNEADQIKVEMAIPERTPEQQKSVFGQAYEYFTEPIVLKGEEFEEEAPIVFSYSLYYVYYDQYTYIRGVLYQNIIIALGTIIICSQILTSLWAAVILAVCVFLVFFELMGVMWMLNVVLGSYPIEVNAVFAVNLVTSLGFGVEFCSHIGMNFCIQEGTREERAKKALKAMGSSVVTGITLTKFLGVMILAFAPSTLFKIYYFRMYMFIIVLGVFNGLFFLPVLLSYIGPSPDLRAIAEHRADFYKMTGKFGRESSEKEKLLSSDTDVPIGYEGKY